MAARLILLLACFLPGACADEGRFVVVSVDAPSDLRPSDRLRLSGTLGAEMDTLETAARDPLVFPLTLSLEIPTDASGTLTLTADALAADGVRVATATGDLILEQGDALSLTLDDRDLYDRFITDPGCATCEAVVIDGELRSSIEGGMPFDTAYGERDLGAEEGMAWPLFLSDSVRIPAGAILGGDLVFFQVRDTADQAVVEFFLNKLEGTYYVYAAAGMLGPGELYASTNLPIVTDGSPVRLELGLHPGEFFFMRVNGTEFIGDSNPFASMSGRARRLRVGIDHYDVPTGADPQVVFHDGVRVGVSGWLAP